MSRKSNIHLDDTELRRLEIDLRGAPARVRSGASQNIRKAARLVDKGMKVDATGHQGNWFGKPGTSYPTDLERHVSHEMLTPLMAEIGIEAKGSGKLAHIIVFGSVKNPPTYDHTAALRRATPTIARMFEQTAEDSVLGTET